MPELPEVETVRKGLNLHLSAVAADLRLLTGVHRSDKELRFAFPSNLKKALQKLPLLGIERRAKYLLFDFGDKILINHLGMTGSWRKASEPRLALHDHVALSFSADLHLIYRDPRRFGYFDLLDKNRWQESPWFSHLGPEPLEAKNFHADYLFELSRGRTAPMKSFIMDQKTVVGVGNIYASEALFLAGIKPQRKAKSLKSAEAETLVTAIRKVLRQSLRQGGSTIRDFVSAEGERGYFAQSLKVYDREGQACRTCGGEIRLLRQAGRSTYWCPECQK
jgi:formamidopyrimidine-DNA glycosylase